MIGEVTSEIIKSAIALKIRSGFAVTQGAPAVTTYPTVYKEEVVQGMTTPAFFIWTMDEAQKQLMLNTYERVYQMNVRYHIADDTPNAYEALTAAGHKLLEVLLSVDVPIWLGNYTTDIPPVPIEDKLPVHGRQMSFEIKEGVLQLYVTYSLRLRRQVVQDPSMATIEVNQL